MDTPRARCSEMRRCHVLRRCRPLLSARWWRQCHGLLRRSRHLPDFLVCYRCCVGCPLIRQKDGNQHRWQDCIALPSDLSRQAVLVRVGQRAVDPSTILTCKWRGAVPRGEDMECMRPRFLPTGLLSTTCSLVTQMQLGGILSPPHPGATKASLMVVLATSIPTSLLFFHPGKMVLAKGRPLHLAWMEPLQPLHLE